MFGSLGLPEILVILVLALLIFGPKRLPEVGRTIGKGLAEFRRATTDLKRSVNAELSLEDDERPPTSRRSAVQGVGRTASEASVSRELPVAAETSEGDGATEATSDGPSGSEAPPGATPRATSAPDGGDAGSESGGSGTNGESRAADASPATNG